MIRWRDAHSACGWMSREELMEPSRVTTVGFLVHETDEFIVVAGSLTDDGDDEMGEVISIPTGWVEEKRWIQ